MKRMHLAALLRQIRVEAELTQSQLADKIGETQSYVSKYESGEQRLDLLELDKVCSAAGISLLELVERFNASR